MPPGGRGGGGGQAHGRGAPPGKGGRTREERKEGRRNKQAEAVAVREKAEDDYFLQCQAQALKSGEAARAKAGLSGKEADAREAALFAQQGSQGIQFDKYSGIEVKVSGPGADATPPLDSFGSLTELPPFLSRNITLMKYATPTPIQKYAIPLALAGRDLMCCAQTGSGKTAAFLIPVCTTLWSASSGGSTVGIVGAAKPRAVVMAPTRELALQIDLEAQKLTNRSALRPVAVYGGADQRGQARSLAVGCDVIVAT